MDLQSWTPAVWDAFKARAITRTAKDVLLTLRTFRGAGGLIYPSHARLAARVGCCVATVKTALAAAREIGLVSWASGRWRRTSNRYVLLMPQEAPVARQPRRLERAVRALVANWQLRGENSFKKGPTSDHVPAPHPPIRSVAEQLTALMRPTSEVERQEVRESLAAIAARRAAERDATRRVRVVALRP